MIKHISFDFWDTLYKGNPNFRKERAVYIEKKYGYAPEQTYTAVSITKKICDDLSEQTMVNIDSKVQAWHILNQLGVPSTKGAVELNEFTQKNFLDNHPIPLFTASDLHDLKRRGLSISISCNTGLINGDSIIAMLQQSNLLDVFDYTLFSDQINHFKPSPFFAEAILNHPKCNAKYLSQILHVGDNNATDGYMCSLTGINYLNVEKAKLDFVEIHKLL